MKKYIITALIVILCVVILFFGLSRKSEKQKSSPIEISNYFKELDSYSTNMVIDVKNTKQSLEYNCRQMYKRGLGYRLEINNDRLLVFKDNKIYVNDIKNNAFYDTDRDFDELYKIGFIGEYIGLLDSQEQEKYTSKVVDKEEYLIIHLNIPSRNENIRSADLWINIKNRIPYKIDIFNSKGEQNVTIIYSDFSSNVKLDDTLFKTKQ